LKLDDDEQNEEIDDHQALIWGWINRNIIQPVVNTVSAAVNTFSRIKDSINNLKRDWSAATFSGGKSCYRSNVQGENICVYNGDMAAFISSQGSMSSIQYSKQFVFEKLLGARMLHVYFGAVAYAGASFRCSGDKTGVEVKSFASARARFNIFNNEGTIFGVSLKFHKERSNPLDDGYEVRYLGFNTGWRRFVPENIRKYVDHCQASTKELLRKDYPEIVKKEKYFVVVSVPIKLTFILSGSMGVDAVADLCPAELRAKFSIEPWFKVNGAGRAEVTILIASAGLEIGAEFNYRLIPNAGTENCKLFVRLDQKVDPLRLSLGLTASALGQSASWEIYAWSAPSINSNLFNYEYPIPLLNNIALKFSQSAHTNVKSPYTLRNGASISSKNGKWTLVMQNDGNLVEYKQHRGAVWASNTWRRGANGGSGNKMVLQNDGNLVIYDSRNSAIWASNTWTSQWRSKYPFYLYLQHDGHLIIKDKNGNIHWKTNVYDPNFTATLGYKESNSLINDELLEIQSHEEQENEAEETLFADDDIQLLEDVERDIF